MFDFDLADGLKIKLRKLSRKNCVLVAAANKKIREIISRDEKSIDSYKNLRHDLKDFKRVHVCGCFVLTFKVDKPNRFILFEDLDHHDRVY